MRGVIDSNNISREEAAALFEVGRYRYDRLRNMNPTLPIPCSNSRPNHRAITAENKEVIRIFMKNKPQSLGTPASTGAPLCTWRTST